LRVGITAIDRIDKGVLLMPVAAMNHFTVLSDDLEATRRFYCDLSAVQVNRPPLLGEHSEALRGEICGVGQDEVRRLRDDGII
jgi:hypothetical protein